MGETAKRLQPADGETKRKRFRLSFYSGALLLVLLILLLMPGKGRESVLFDKNSPVTLYAKTAVGVKPELDAADYFPEEGLDAAKFSYDWDGCDLKTPGEYQIPVYYGGKRTNCVIRLEVLPDAKETPGVLELPGEGEGDGTSIQDLPAAD